MKVIGKMTVLSLVASSVLFGATATTNDVDVQTLAKEMSQTNDPAQRAEMMNDIKSSLANMNEAQREGALKGIRDGVEREHEKSQSEMSSHGQEKERGQNSVAKGKHGSDNTGNNEMSSNSKDRSGTESSNNGDHKGNDGDHGGGNQGAGNAGNSGHGGADAGNSGHGGGDAGNSGDHGDGDHGGGDAGNSGDHGDGDHGGGDAGDSNGGSHD